MESTPLLSIITTCKNRLHHLQQTLPFMLKQSHSEVIVVDYNCSQNTSEWVNHHYSQVKVITDKEAGKFNASIARNMGAKYAKGKWLLFVDADIFLNKDLGLWLKENEDERSFYYTGVPSDSSTHGTVICSRESFERVAGYDEVFTHWGGEDTDLYSMLQFYGYQLRQYPADAIESIQHGDEERGFVVSRDLSKMVNHIYRAIKMDILKLSGKEVDIALRKQVFELIREQLISHYDNHDDSKCNVEITLADNILERKLNYAFAPILKIDG